MSKIQRHGSQRNHGNITNVVIGMNPPWFQMRTRAIAYLHCIVQQVVWPLQENIQRAFDLSYIGRTLIDEKGMFQVIGQHIQQRKSQHRNLSHFISYDQGRENSYAYHQSKVRFHNQSEESNISCKKFLILKAQDWWFSPLKMNTISHLDQAWAESTHSCKWLQITCFKLNLLNAAFLYRDWNLSISWLRWAWTLYLVCRGGPWGKLPMHCMRTWR